jgi:SAM-dependent methyltransferase
MVEGSPEARDPVGALTDRYDRHAKAYRELWASILRSAALPLVRELEGPAEFVLDVGAGVGTLLPDLAAAFPRARVIGVDRSRGMLALAPSRYGRSLMDARQLAVASRSVDRVLLVFMLFHLEDPLLALREARRVLRPGGRVGTLTWGGELESVATRAWSECLDQHGAIPPDPALDARDEAVGSPGSMVALLTSAGFASPRAWADDLVCAIDAEHLVQLRTRMGSSKARFDSLSPAQATACLEAARAGFGSLGPDAFIARGRVVYAIGGG